MIRIKTIVALPLLESSLYGNALCHIELKKQIKEQAELVVTYGSISIVGITVGSTFMEKCLVAANGKVCLRSSLL
jgi:hypothetical protein